MHLFVASRHDFKHQFSLPFFNLFGGLSDTISHHEQMISAAKIHEALRQNGVTHVVGLADNICRQLFYAIDEDPDMELIHVSREGEAFAIAAGLYLGGKKALVLIQNTGFLESGDAFRGASWNMRIPQVILMGYRGHATLAPDIERRDSVAELTEPTLNAWNIPYKLMESDDDIPMISHAFAAAESIRRPTAVLITRSTV